MFTFTKPLFTLTAEDVMSREVLTLPEHMSLRAAAEMLSQIHVSGAPVVDETGRCVGVLSTADLARWVNRRDEPGRCGKVTVCVCSDWQVIEVERLPEVEVRGYMTPAVVTASPSTGIVDLAERMAGAHVHRVIILDAERRPVGVVTSMDLVTALARAGHPAPAIPEGS